MKHLLCILLLLPTLVAAQNPGPWENPLLWTVSDDGQHFSPPQMFQDSAGVPCVIHWKGDTLVCVFQWFRLPQGSPSWDRVAIKFSYDGGASWTQPQPIEIADFPANYQRPFDPTICLLPSDSLRIYYSSSDGMPMGGLNAAVNTYSAISADGVHYHFEPGARFDHPSNRVIDPAVTRFNGSWHYLSPIGAPQDGAYHCVSPDGLVFQKVPNYPSDNQHNWTGNFLPEPNGTLRFYGSGPLIWYNTSSNGGQWGNYVATNVQGGDPGIAHLPDGRYFMVYVGPANFVATNETNQADFQLFPNPAHDFFAVKTLSEQAFFYKIFNSQGQMLREGKALSGEQIQVIDLCSGTYFLQIWAGDEQKWVLLLRY